MTKEKCINFNEQDKKDLALIINDEKKVAKFLFKTISSECREDWLLAENLFMRSENKPTLSRDVLFAQAKLSQKLHNDQKTISLHINLIKSDKIDSYTLSSFKYLSKLKSNSNQQNAEINIFCQSLYHKIKTQIAHDLISNKYIGEIMPICGMWYKDKIFINDEIGNNILMDKFLLASWELYQNNFALFELAHAYHYGITTRKDINKAEGYYQNIRNINKDAKYELTKIYLEQSKNLEQILENLNELHNAEHEDAMYLKSTLIREGKLCEKSIEDSNAILKDLASKDNKQAKFQYSYNLLKDEIFYDQSQEELWVMLKSVEDEYLKAHVMIVDNMKWNIIQSLNNCKPSSSLGFGNFNKKSSLEESKGKLEAFESLLNKPYIKNNQKIQEVLKSIDYKKTGPDIKKLGKEFAKILHPDKIKYNNLEGYEEKDFNTLRLYIEDMSTKGNKEEGWFWSFWSIFSDEGKKKNSNEVIGEENRQAECTAAKNYVTNLVTKMSKSTDKMIVESLDEKIHHHVGMAEFLLKSEIFNNMDGFDRNKEYENHMLQAINIGGDEKIKYNLAVHYTKLQTKEGLHKAVGILNVFTKLELSQSVCSNFLKESIQYLIEEKVVKNSINFSNSQLAMHCKEEAKYFAKVYNKQIDINNLNVDRDYSHSCKYYKVLFSSNTYCSEDDKILYDELSHVQQTMCGKDACETFTTDDF